MESDFYISGITSSNHQAFIYSEMLHMIMIPADHPTPISFENIRDDNDNDNVYFIKLY